jgi:uncharacterized integral membrane protein
LSSVNFSRRQRSGGEEEVRIVKAFFGVGFLFVVIVAIFAVQNSDAPPVTIKFLVWKFETSLAYTILGSIVLGILLTLSFWAGRAIRASIRKKELPEEVGTA